MKSNAEQLSGLMEFLNSQTHVTPEEIPNIDLYMDQVTTFMAVSYTHLKRELYNAVNASATGASPLTI